MCPKQQLLIAMQALEESNKDEDDEEHEESEGEENDERDGEESDGDDQYHDIDDPFGIEFGFDAYPEEVEEDDDKMCTFELIKAACRANDSGYLTTAMKSVDINTHYGVLRNTALHVASQSEECTRVLLQRNANVNAVTSMGVTPLHLACAQDCTATAKLLLENGADVSAKDNSQSTARDVAIRTSLNCKLLCEVARKAVINDKRVCFDWPHVFPFLPQEQQDEVEQASRHLFRLRVKWELTADLANVILLNYVHELWPW